MLYQQIVNEYVGSMSELHKYIINPRPAGAFARTRPAGGGVDSAPPPLA